MFSKIAFTILIAGICVWLVISLFNTSLVSNGIVEDIPALDTTETVKPNAEFVKAVISNEDTSEKIIRVSEARYLDIPHSVDNKAGSTSKRIFTGRRINIALIGVDSRLGVRYKHADANHVLSFLIDQGKIEITSIPRDTPADAGYDDTTGLNKLTVFYAAKGRRAYLNEVAQIAGLDKIHYYAELGFSQAIGILEWLGYHDGGSTLQVLRSRTGLGGDDYQRVYNQAQFIKQMMLKNFNQFTGFLGGMLVKGGLMLIESDLPPSIAEDIVTRLESAGFPRSSEDIEIRVRPPINIDYRIYDFSDLKVLEMLQSKILSYNSKNGNGANHREEALGIDDKVQNKLISVIEKAIADSARNSTAVINNLKVLFDQRAWLQIKDTTLRAYYRDEFANLLCNAYEKKKQPELASRVRKIVSAEKMLFENKSN